MKNKLIVCIFEPVSRPLLDHHLQKIYCALFFQEKFLSTIIVSDDIEELAIMKHRFESFENEMNASASKVAVVNQLARQLLQVEHPNAEDVIGRQNQLNQG